MIKAAKSKVSLEVMKSIDAIEISERLGMVRRRYFVQSPITGIELMKLAIESWKETQGEDVYLRRVNVLQKISNNMPLVIHDAELTAGSITPSFRGAHPAIDYDSQRLKFNFECH